MHIFNEKANIWINRIIHKTKDLALLSRRKFANSYQLFRSFYILLVVFVPFDQWMRLTKIVCNIITSWWFVWYKGWFLKVVGCFKIHLICLNVTPDEFSCLEGQRQLMWASLGHRAWAWHGKCHFNRPGWQVGAQGQAFVTNNITLVFQETAILCLPASSFVWES